MTQGQTEVQQGQSMVSESSIQKKKELHHCDGLYLKNCLTTFCENKKHTKVIKKKLSRMSFNFSITFCFSFFFF